LKTGLLPCAAKTPLDDSRQDRTFVDRPRTMLDEEEIDTLGGVGLYAVVGRVPARGEWCAPRTPDFEVIVRIPPDQALRSCVWPDLTDDTAQCRLDAVRGQRSLAALVAAFGAGPIDLRWFCCALRSGAC